MHITAGAFDSISSLPVGWYFLIDNDASWQTYVQANARVGSAALDADSVKKISINVIENEFGDLKYGLSGTLIVTSDFVNQRRILLSMTNFLPK